MNAHDGRDAAPGAAIDVSIISVTYRSLGWIADALGTARASVEAAGLRAEVIVVDNASDDGSAEAALAADPSAALIRLPANVGFGVANNLAFESARGATWLLVNPDARLEPGAVGRLVDFLAVSPRTAIAAPSIAGPGGAESAGMLPSLPSAVGHFLFVNRLPVAARGAWRGFQLPRGAARPLRVEWASAAVLAVRPAAIREVGGFDPTIFLYGEDVDLAARLGDAGWEVWLVPQARAWHGIAASSAGVSTGWVDGLDRYVRRRGMGRLRRALFDAIVASGLALRAAAARGRGRGPDERRHAVRMLSAARRAGELAVSALAGRPPVDERRPSR